MKKFYLILATMLALFAATATAQSALDDKLEFNGPYYRATSLSPKEVKVVTEPNTPHSSGSSYYTPANEPNGTIAIPLTVTSPHSETFAVAAIGTALTSITIPESVENVGYEAFRYCKALTTVTLPSTLTTIQIGLFKNCQNSTAITLPSTLTAIKGRAFENCLRLATIECKVNDPNDITTEDLFLNVGYLVNGGTTLYVPVGSKTLYETANQWQNFNIEEGFVGIHPISKSQIRLAVSGGTLSLANLLANQMVKIYSLTGELMHQVAADSNHNTQITLPQESFIVQAGQ